MKKAIGMIISIIITLSLCACSWLQNLSYNAEVEKALGALETGWKEFYAEANGDGYVEIKNTRVVKLKETAKETFPDAEYVVEFVLFTDYMGSAPYYVDAGTMDSVVIYADGKAEMQKMNPVDVYRGKYYKMDIVEEVIDLGDAYNRTWDLK